MNEPLKILFKFPCRGRELLLFQSLDSLNDNIRDRNNYHISITIDHDDTILNTKEVIDKIFSYPNTSIGIGSSKSKVEAFNRSFPDYEYDVLVAWSNDMFLTIYGADDIIRGYLHHVINNHGDNFLAHFPEPDSMEHLNVLYIATKKYYDMFGYIYHESYKSLWCDNETICVAKLLDKYHYIGTIGLYQHKNPSYSNYNMERDELFNEQQGHWGEDEANFHKRKANNFDLHLLK